MLYNLFSEDTIADLELGHGAENILSMDYTREAQVAHRVILQFQTLSADSPCRADGIVHLPCRA